MITELLEDLGLMANMAETLKEIARKYENFVTSNPETVGHVEATCRVLSYLIAGRFENGAVLSELLYSASNLLVLYNDTLIRKKAGIKIHFPEHRQHILYWLTTLDHVEVFLELGAHLKGGATGRWIVIACLQLVKACLRLFMLVSDKIGVQPTPPLQPLNRRQVKKKKLEEEQKNVPGLFGGKNGGPVKPTFTLEASGRTVRTLAIAPPVKQRTWQLPQPDKSPETAEKTDSYSCHPSRLNSQQMKAEALHIVRPLIHLIGMYLFGEQSWKPWMMACSTDVASLCMMGEPTDFNPAEQTELKRRAVVLLFYLMRSPFYDNYTKARVFWLLNGFAKYIPGLGLIAKPLLEYLPVWQKIYSYVWVV